MTDLLGELLQVLLPQRVLVAQKLKFGRHFAILFAKFRVLLIILLEQSGNFGQSRLELGRHFLAALLLLADALHTLLLDGFVLSLQFPAEFFEPTPRQNSFAVLSL